MAEKIVLLLGTAADELADALAPELGARVLRVRDLVEAAQDEDTALGAQVRRFLHERKLIPAAVQVALLAREFNGQLTLLADFPCSESQLRELERTAGHVLCALCAGPTPIAEAVARPMRADGRVRDVGVGEGALSAALAALAAFGVVREDDTVPEIVPAVLRTGFAAVPSPSSRTTRSAARLGLPPPLDDFDLPFAPAAPWIAPGTPEVDGLTQGTPYLERALAAAVPTAAQQLWAAKLDRSAASLDRHARSAAALPTSALPASASVPALLPSKRGPYRANFDFSARGRPNAFDERPWRKRDYGADGGRAPCAWSNATAPPTSPLSAFKPASRPATAPPRPPPPPSEPLESWWPPARDGQASTLSLASTLPRTPARRRAIRSEPSLSFPAWYPTAARLALWPHSTGVPSPAPARSPPAPPAAADAAAADDGTRSYARAAQSAGALRRAHHEAMSEGARRRAVSAAGARRTRQLREAAAERRAAEERRAEEAAAALAPRALFALPAWQRKSMTMDEEVARLQAALSRQLGHNDAAAAEAAGGPATGAAVAAEVDSAAAADPLERIASTLKQHLQRVIDLFRSWDINGDGQVSRGEFRKACGALGLVASNDAGLEEIDALFSRLDPDGSGSIEFKELNALLKQETSWRGAGPKGSFKAKAKPAAKGDGSQTRFNFKTERSRKRLEILAAGSASSLASLGGF